MPKPAPVLLEPPSMANQMKWCSFVSKKSSNSAGTLISVIEEDKNFFHTELETPQEYDDKGRRLWQQYSKRSIKSIPSQNSGIIPTKPIFAENFVPF